MNKTLVTIFFLSSVLLSCVHNKVPESSYGINPARTGFVPARIGLVPCMNFPERSTRISHLPLTNRPKEEIAKFCEDFDKYVADGFDNQPFMKGLSPKLVEKLYVSANATPPIQEAITSEWRSLATDCQDCSNLPTLYNASIKPRASWQIWLNKFSSSTKGTDAILIPLVLSENTRIEDDRGILQSIRSGSIAMLLIDTNDGSLIWSGGREADVIFKALVNTKTKAEMKEPPVDDLKRRLLTEAIWIGFPGRQIYR